MENKRKRKRTFASRPLDFCFFSREVLGGGNRTGEGLRRRFQRGSAPAARGKLGKRVRGLVRTCRWSQLGLRWPVVACPRAPAAGGGPVPRLRHSGEGEAAWLGLGAPLGRGETVPEVYWSWGRPEVGAQRGGRGRRQPWQPAAVLDGPAQRGNGLGASARRSEGRGGIKSGRGRVERVLRGAQAGPATMAGGDTAPEQGRARALALARGEEEANSELAS